MRRTESSGEMPLDLEASDFVPATDPPLSPEQHESFRTRIQTYLPVNYKTRPHHDVDTDIEVNFAKWVLEEGQRVAEDRPLPEGEGIDLSRYEADALEPPPRTTPTSDEDRPELLQQWRETLQRAYSTSTYLSGRLTNLSLLETYGKNAWLVGNSQLEDVLRDLEREIERKRKEVEGVEELRRVQGERLRPQMDALEQEWKRAVGGIVDVQLATEELRSKINAAKRAEGTRT
jgi:pre-mRNA-splicing factor SPF27